MRYPDLACGEVTPDEYNEIFDVEPPRTISQEKTLANSEKINPVFTKENYMTKSNTSALT